MLNINVSIEVIRSLNEFIQKRGRVDKLMAQVARLEILEKSLGVNKHSKIYISIYLCAQPNVRTFNL